MNRPLFVSLLLLFTGLNLSAQFTWSNPQPSGYNNNKVLFADASTGYIMNDNGDLISTTNAGTTWKVKQNFPLCTAMHLLDSVFVIAGADTTSYISTDRGETWSTSSIKQNKGINKVEVVSKDTIFMVGPTQLYQSVNRGKTWDLVNSSFIIKSVDFINSKLGFATSFGGIFKTIDGGKTWQNVYTPTSGYSFITIEFRDQYNGFSYQESGPLMRTTDGGASWTVSKSDFASKIYSIAFANATTIFIGGEDGHIYRSNDNGSTWVYKRPNNTGDRFGIYSVAFVNENLAFAVRYKGTNF